MNTVPVNNQSERIILNEIEALHKTRTLIDFGSFRTGTITQRKQIAKKITSAFTDYGYIVITNHGIHEELISSVFEESREFFSFEEATKKQYSYRSHEANRGYISVGSEKVHFGLKDIKETMEIGKEGEKGAPNKWPIEQPSFKQPMIAAYQHFDKLNLEILSCIEIALNIPIGSISKDCDNQNNNLRLLHYPSVHSSNINESVRGTKRCAEHTDYGTITLLLQDEAGGLQVRLQNGNWVDIEPIKGGIIVQVGDMLERWTNGMLKAARHRVVSPKPLKHYKGMLPERYSVAYFCNPNKDAIIKALPNTFNENNPILYKPFNAMDYLKLRLKASL